MYNLLYGFLHRAIRSQYWHFIYKPNITERRTPFKNIQAVYNYKHLVFFRLNMTDY